MLLEKEQAMQAQQDRIEQLTEQVRQLQAVVERLTGIGLGSKK